MKYLGPKYDQRATCLPRTAVADQRLQSLALVDPRTARRLRITRAHATNKKQYTKQYKQHKMRI